MQNPQLPEFDRELIEERARQMRAEVVAHGAKTMTSWVKSLFRARAHGETAQV